jgi:hypothetical protein
MHINELSGIAEWAPGADKSAVIGINLSDLTLSSWPYTVILSEAKDLVRWGRDASLPSA